MNRLIALIVAPFKDRTQEEEQRTDEAIARLVRQGWCPVFLPYALQRALHDGVPEERVVALECSDAFTRALARQGASCFVLYGRVTEGMKLDLDVWEKVQGKGQWSWVS
jgi:hypothetical protein